MHVSYAYINKCIYVYIQCVYEYLYQYVCVFFFLRHPSTGFHRYSSSHHPQLQIAILISPTSWFPGFMGTKCKEIMQHPMTEKGKICSDSLLTKTFVPSRGNVELDKLNP